jgi:hypothetical protein
MFKEEMKLLDNMYANISKLSEEQLEQLTVELLIAQLTGEISAAEAAVIADMILLSAVERAVAMQAVAAGAVIN